MASVLNLLGDWSAGNPERERLYAMNKGLVLRWLNEGQLRFADRSEVLRGRWSPTLASDGKTSLPDDFLRMTKNRVKWGDDTLAEIGYADALNVDWTDTTHYSIWDGKLYVWAASAGSAEIAYIRKPDEITQTSMSTADLEIPTEYHGALLAFMDAMWYRHLGQLDAYHQMVRICDGDAREAGLRHSGRVDSVPRMKGGWL